VETGPLRGTLEIKRRILNSSFTQRISLAYNSPRIDFETTIDWVERHILLKVAFTVDVLSPFATYEIQFGNVERSTHRNTSWDWARFENAAQKWVDLSEGDYGVSLLNDCKYGHNIQGNLIRLSLLRSPTLPDPEADQGTHRFTYSLLPHAGDWRGHTIPQAYALNDPMAVYKPLSARKTELNPIIYLSVDAPNLVVETVKQAEDGDGVIVRLYECHRTRGTATLTTLFPISAAQETNLLEETISDLEVDGKEVVFEYKPYEIITLRLKFEKLG
jgi:alpha-mannosidase